MTARHRTPPPPRRRPSRAAAVAALIAALLVAPGMLFAVADPAPPDDDGADNITGPADPGVTDNLTGGLLPSAPVPTDPTPDTLPPVPTELDPQGEPDNSPVTVAVSGDGISGSLTFTGRDVSGTATGLTPGRRYVSLLYGDMSTARPGEPLTCADARTAVSVRSWAVSGEWAVDRSGDATLTGTASRDLADGVDTVSIRQVGGAAAVSDESDPLTGFTPVTSPVVACGPVPGA